MIYTIANIIHALLLAAVPLVQASVNFVGSEGSPKIEYCQPFTFNFDADEPFNISVNALVHSQIKSTLLATNTTETSFNWKAVDFPAGSKLLVVLWGAEGSSATWEMGTVVKSSQPCNESLLTFPLDPASLPSSSKTSTTSSQVILETCDKEQFSVDKEVAERSLLLKSMLNDLGGMPEQAIPLPNITANVFKKVLEYCEHHRGDPMPAQTEENVDENRMRMSKIDDWDSEDWDSEDPSVEQEMLFEEDRRRSTELDNWDSKFSYDDEDMLFDIIIAAHYLQIKPLVEVGTKTVANKIKGMNPTEIRNLFNVKNDFTPEEEAQTRKENEWVGER